MKPLYIEFVPSKRWLWVWASSAAIAMAVVLLYAWRIYPLQQAQAQASQQLAALQADLLRLQQVKPPPPSPLQRSAEAAQRMLAYDLNKAFAAAENINIPGARLSSFYLDMNASILRMEYELDSVSLATDLTEAMNTGYDSRPWQLESISGNTNAQSPIGMATKTTYKAKWSVKLEKL